MVLVFLMEHKRLVGWNDTEEIDVVFKVE